VRGLMFCESPSDFQHAAELIDRVLREHGPSWISDVMDVNPEGVRQWHPSDATHPFFDVHAYREHAGRLGLRIPHGHFNGAPGAAGSLMARTLFLIARKLNQRGSTIEAVVLLWDMDGDGANRRIGLEQARTEATSWAKFAIVIGCPDLTREAWVLAGFEPTDDGERERLGELRQELGFHPTGEAHRLDSSDEQAKRNPKRVLRILTDGLGDRQQQCWQAIPLETLRARGHASGLADYLREVEEIIVPRCTGVRPLDRTQ
jgi:hypothetical protein